MASLTQAVGRVKLYIRYATSTAEKGRLRFLSDVYGRDAVIRCGLFGPAS